MHHHLVQLRVEGSVISFNIFLDDEIRRRIHSKKRRHLVWHSLSFVDIILTIMYYDFACEAAVSFCI